MKVLHRVLVMAIACGLTADAVSAGTTEVARQSGSSRLIIKRAANFGTFASVNLYIDGMLVNNLGYNRSFDTTLAPGSHVLTLQQVPRWGGAYQITNQRITLIPGQAAVFTVMTDDGGKKAVLVSS